MSDLLVSPHEMVAHKRNLAEAISVSFHLHVPTAFAQSVVESLPPPMPPDQALHVIFIFILLNAYRLT